MKLKEKRTHRKQAMSAVRIPPEEPALARSSEPERLRMRLKPQTLLEAVKELESDGQVFHVFLDEESGEIRIAFQRADGTVAVIEPVLP